MPVTRRLFLKGSFLGSGMAFTGAAFGRVTGTLSSLATNGDSHLPLQRVVFDRRFTAGTDFGQAARHMGFRTHAISGDITDLWVHALSAEWRKAPTAIAGLTTFDALFCLERFGWDHRMKVVFRGEHKRYADGRSEHALSGPVSMVRAVSPLALSENGLGRCMASVVAHCPRQPAASSTGTIGTPSLAINGPESLYSWVIAPRA